MKDPVWLQLMLRFAAWVWSFYITHKIACTLGITAFIKVMPIPGQPWRPYVVFYDWIHQYLNFPNLRLTNVPVVSPPSPQEPENKIGSAAVLPHAPQFDPPENKQ